MNISNQYLMSAADLPSDLEKKIRDNINAYSVQRAEAENTKKAAPTESANYNPRIELSRDEANLLKSFRLEEYVALTKRMQREDPAQYKAHQNALTSAEDSGNLSAKIRELTKPYTWAYGDVLDEIHKEFSDLDIFIKSAGTPEDYEFRSEYQKTHNNPYLVLTTDEIQLLQSKNEKDKAQQDKLWAAIRERIHLTMQNS